MNAEDYNINHWEKRKIWNNLKTDRHQRRLSKCARLMKGEKFIDIGCAFGHSTNILKKFYPGNWSGLDFSKHAINRANQFFPEMVFYYAENFQLLSVCGEFDGVVCSEVIEHVEDDENLVKGLIEITKKILVITTPCRNVDDPGHLRIYTEEMLANLFGGYNFEVIREGTFFYGIIKKNGK